MDSNIILAMFSGFAIGMIAPTTSALILGLIIVGMGVLFSYIVDKE